MSLVAVCLLNGLACDDAALAAPSPHDAHGWALRVRGKMVSGPFFRTESLYLHEFEVTLSNTGAEAKAYPALEDARKTAELSVRITRGNGEVVNCDFHPIPRRRIAPLPELRPGERASGKFTLSGFGYHRFRQVGEYKAQLEFQTPQGKVVSPPWRFSVIDVPEVAVIASHPVPVVGSKAELPPAAQDKLFVQQVKIGDRVYLVYRQFASEQNHGVLSATHRLAVLRSEVAMAVDGGYDVATPLAITYSTSPTSKPTTLVINSIGVQPWTEADERFRQERLRARNGLPPLTPPPQLIKP